MQLQFLFQDFEKGIFFIYMQNIYTVNVDIFTCINFREIMKMGNFACNKIHVLSATGF